MLEQALIGAISAIFWVIVIAIFKLLFSLIVKGFRKLNQNNNQEAPASSHPTSANAASQLQSSTTAGSHQTPER